MREAHINSFFWKQPRQPTSGQGGWKHKSAQIRERFLVFGQILHISVIALASKRRRVRSEHIYERFRV
jgi:hypothetical protein